MTDAATLVVGATSAALTKIKDFATSLPPDQQADLAQLADDVLTAHQSEVDSLAAESAAKVAGMIPVPFAGGLIADLAKSEATKAVNNLAGKLEAELAAWKATATAQEQAQGALLDS